MNKYINNLYNKRVMYMGIIVRNMNMANFSHVRLGRQQVSGRPSDIEDHGEVVMNNTTWGYLIPLQNRYTKHPTIPGITLTYPENYYNSNLYYISAMLNRTRASNSDGFLSSGTAIVFTFHEPFYMDAYYIRGLRSDNWKPGGHAVEIMFLGDDFYTTIRTNGGIGTGGYLHELTPEQANRPIERVRLRKTGGWLSYSRFDLLIRK